MLKAQTGKSQVDVIAHSEGTTVVYDYLTEGAKAPARRATVAAYATSTARKKTPACARSRCGRGDAVMPPAQTRTAHGRRGKRHDPNATHVQTSTSAETFQHIFKFFTGKLPERDIVAQKGTIMLAGKALEFPQNTGLVGDTVQVWPIDFDGARTASKPLASFEITNGSTGAGEWGPVVAKAGSTLRIRARSSRAKTPPYVHGAVRQKRLGHPPAGSAPIENETGKFPGSSGAVIIRYKELWGNQPGEDDELLINGVNVCTAALCPWTKEVNAFFAFNWEGKEESTLSEEPVLSKLPFIQAAQVFIPGANRRTPSTPIS